MTRGEVQANVVLTVVFSIVACNAFAIGDHYGKDYLTLTIEKIQPLKDGKIEIHYRTLVESVWWCPGANGRKTDAGTELTFVRASYKHKPKVTYPRMPGDKGASIIVVPNDGKPIFRVAGEKRIQVYDVPKTDFADRISKLVTKHFPNAVVSQDDGTLSAKHGTMVFTIHLHWMTGEIREETAQVEGPNYKGFMISISVHEGNYEGQLCVPQTLSREYWKTYIDGPPTEDGKGHYAISFSYGSRLDKDFMKAVFETLPRSRRPTKPPTATE